MGFVIITILHLTLNPKPLTLKRVRVHIGQGEYLPVEMPSTEVNQCSNAKGSQIYNKLIYNRPPALYRLREKTPTEGL